MALYSGSSDSCTRLQAESLLRPALVFERLVGESKQVPGTL